MKYSREETERALEIIENYRGEPIGARVNHVSRSGMSRRIEFYGVEPDGSIARIGYYIAVINETPYNADKGGLNVSGCGMDMIFSELSNFNYRMADIDGKSKELKAAGKRIYDNYFFDADRYRTL